MIYSLIFLDKCIFFKQKKVEVFVMENMNKSYKEEELIKDEDINISDSNVYKPKSFAHGSNKEQSFFSKG